MELIKRIIARSGEPHTKKGGIVDSILNRFHLARLVPTDDVEHQEELVAQSRACAATRILEIRRPHKAVAKAITNRTESYELDPIACATSDLAGQPGPNLIYGYNRRLNHMYHGSLQNQFPFADIKHYQTNLDSNKDHAINYLYTQSRVQS